MSFSKSQEAALAAARHLAENGVPIFLAKPARTESGDWDPHGGKSRTGYHLPPGWESVEADPAIIDDWDLDYALCAVSGHGIDVIDVDPRNGGKEGFNELVIAGLLPNTYGRSRTPSGGTHNFIASLDVRKRTNFLPGVDVLAGTSDGGGRGFVFLPPTRRASKVTGEIVTYEWERPPEVETVMLIGGDDSGSKLAAQLHRPMPERPIADLDRPPTEQELAKAASVLAKAVREVSEAPDGNRNNTLMQHLPTLYRFVLGDCLDEAVVDDRMRGAAYEAGIDDEYDDVSRSAWRYADRAERPEVASAADDFAPDSISGLWSATPTLAKVQRAAHARLLSAPALLAYILGRVLADTSPNVTLPPVVGGRASLNLGFAVVGTSGAGKSSLLAVSRELLGLPQDDIERSIGSGEGLVQSFLRMSTERKANVLIDDPRRLFVADEIDQLGATQRRNGSTIAPVLRSALTGGPLGQANATADRNRHVAANSYRAVLFIGVQPTRSDALLDDSDAGTPQRLVWVPAEDPTIPDELVEWPGSLAWSSPLVDGDIPYPAHIAAEVRAARLRHQRGTGDPRDGHLLLTRLKVAAALALLHNEAKISDQWWELAGHIIDVSQAVQELCRRALSESVIEQRRVSGRLDGVRAEGLALHRSENVEKAAKNVREVVSKHATEDEATNRKHDVDDGCTRRCITWALRHFPDKTLRSPAVEHALDLDWIVERDERWFPGSSRPA